MHIHLAPQSIEALAMVISGGGGNDTTPPIGIYRSASKLESFMRGCNVAMRVGNGSRMPALIETLERANLSGDQTVLRNIIERAADPRDFLSAPDRLQAVIDHLNARLRYDGLELQRVGAGVRLGTPGRSSSVVDALANAVVVIDFDTVTRDLDRALASAEVDPEDAVTSACSVVESVCRSVLIELGRRILRSYACYYNGIRTHRSLGKDAPISRPVQRAGSLKTFPTLVLKAKERRNKDQPTV